MLQIILKSIYRYYSEKNRWWIPVIAGFLFPLCMPPFNGDTYPLLFPVPLLSFISLIPLFAFATVKSFKRSFFHSFLFLFCASMGQYYWIGFVTAEGLWHLIIIGLVAASILIALYYLIAAILFRLVKNVLPRGYILFFPAIWIGIDYLRSITDISFPWNFLGYSFISYLPLAQLASLTGVWGLTFLIVLGNILILELLESIMGDRGFRAQKWIHLIIFSFALIGFSVWGFAKVEKVNSTPLTKVTLAQPNLDQLHWGSHSIDSAFAITESLTYVAKKENPEFIIFPESALLTFIDHRTHQRQRILKLVDSVNIPIIFGSIDFTPPPTGSYYDYLAYNTSFMAKPKTDSLERYYKIKLVPFSEIMPFEAKFPILSRVNLGEADFQRGEKQVIYNINDKCKGAPFICYEIIYPGFVQKRLQKGANLILAVTNDGWFGKTSGPFQHAAMARMRSIENGVSMVRCANSGISMFVTPSGKILKQTKLYKRELLTAELPLQNATTFYAKYGDWFMYFCVFVGIIGVVLAVLKLLLNPKKKQEIEIDQKETATVIG